MYELVTLKRLEVTSNLTFPYIFTLLRAARVHVVAKSVY